MPALLHSILTGSFILVFVSGCGRSAPAPVVNPPAVETSLASTARAFAKQTETANPFTASPSPTVTVTLTSTPKISLNGMSLATSQGQSTVFTDHKLGYRITIPPGWMPVRINEEEYYKAFTQDAILNQSVLANFLTNMQKQDANYFRVSLIDIQPEHIDSGILSVITVILQPDDGGTLQDWAKSKSARASTMEGYKLISTRFVETDSGTRVLAREESWPSSTAGNRYGRSIFFDLPSGILSVDLDTSMESKDITLPDLEKIVNSLTLLNP